MLMEPKFFALHVEDIDASVALYTGLLGITPERPSPTFAAFPLSTGVFFELQKRAAVMPPSEATAGAMEVCFPAVSRAEIDRLCTDWRTRGMRIVQEPADMVFGYTFTALDPDGHRLRVIFDPKDSEA